MPGPSDQLSGPPSGSRPDLPSDPGRDPASDPRRDPASDPRPDASALRSDPASDPRPDVSALRSDPASDPRPDPSALRSDPASDPRRDPSALRSDPGSDPRPDASALRSDPGSGPRRDPSALRSDPASDPRRDPSSLRSGPPPGPPSVRRPDSAGPDPKAAAIRAGVYLFLLFVPYYFAGWLITALAGYLMGATLSIFVAAWLANHLAVRIFEDAHIRDIGLYARAPSWRNLWLGVAGGAATAALVLAPPLVIGAARLVYGGERPDWSTAAFVITMLFVGAAGEEMAFHGYAFQVMLRRFGSWGVIFAFGAFFAVMHGANPNSTRLALVNTAGFGILFGYAFLRSRDLWFPIGLHFGWNLSLPLFGVNMSGFTMRVTDYTMQWSASPLWSGGEYGPEGSVLTSLALVFLFLFLWRAPVVRQSAPLAEPSRES